MTGTYDATFKVAESGLCLPISPKANGDPARPWRIVQVRGIPTGTPMSRVQFKLNRTAIIGRLGTNETNFRVIVQWSELGLGRILR